MPRLSNERHEAFCRHYLKTWSFQEAAYAVGLTAQRGREIALQNDVATRISELNDAMLKACDITAKRIMIELGRVALSDIRGIVDERGRLKPLKDLDDDVAGALASIEIETRMERDGEELDLVTGEMRPKFISVQTAKIKRYDKNPALNILAKHFKIVGDEGDGVNALANALSDRLKLARKRVVALPDSTQEIDDVAFKDKHVQRRASE